MPSQNTFKLEEYSSDFTISDAMRALRVSRQTIYDLMKDGTLPFYLVKSKRRIPHEAVNRLRGNIQSPAAHSCSADRGPISDPADFGIGLRAD